MGCEDLRDLALAGVQWELDDVPMAYAAARPVKSASATTDAPAAPDPIAEAAQIGAPRVATTVVPPIAPVQPISIATAAAMAARPIEMQALNRMIAEFNHPLRAAATNVVLPWVAPNPNGMLVITDIPSSEDDETGRILSGPAGQLMDKMLGAIGMSRDNVSILPMLFWRTPGGRTPTADELALARPFVDRAIELIAPRLILTIGTMPAEQIGGVNLARAHGAAVKLACGATLLPIFHPNYLILKPAAKRDAWDALQNVQNLLKNA